MSKPETAPSRQAAPPGWAARLHQALMPDYNPVASRYWWMVTLAGAAALAHSVLALGSLSPMGWLQVLVGVALTMGAAIFPVRVPNSKNSFAAGEIFMFLLLLLQGTSAATVAAAAEGAVGSFRTSKRWTSRLASPAVASLAMFASGSLFEATMALLKRHGLTNDGLIVVAAMALGLAYFVSNTLMVSMVLLLKRSVPFHAADLLGLFGWIGVATGGSAAVSALLFITYRQSGIGVLMAIVPAIGMLMATLHYFFRQQEINEAARLAASEAADREALAKTRHVWELEASERRFHSAFTHASIGMSLMSFDGEILQANTAMRELLGRPDEDLVHRGIHEFVCTQDLSALTHELRRLHTGQVEDIALELRCLHRDGSTRWVAAHGSLFSDIGASAPSLILQAHDITARRKAEADLQHIAFHDALTGLPNRRRFHEHLTSAVQDVLANPQRRFAVMFLDFDRFKLINDSLGHNAGDDFLVQVAGRLQRCLRPSDIVARLGGDEFAVLASELESDDTAIELAERLLLALKQPFFVFGTQLNTSASIGITRSSFGYQRPEDVLRDADIAMYRAKATGKARYALFDSGLHEQVSRRLRLEGDLRRALAAGQIELDYQPVFNLADGAVAGFEALARWTHPSLGIIPPSVFVPIAEETGMIVALTDMMLARACQQLKRWQERWGDRHIAFGALTVQVNISGRDLAHAGFVGRVSQALLDAGILPRQLTLELTENILMNQIEHALPLLDQLRALGVGLSVDDFGTGYSSLGHLATLPIDSLKVDRSFVRALGVDSKESAVVRAVVRAVVQLGASLGKVVVAEGIETESQLSQLRDMGCVQGQGYWLSRPLTAREVERMLGGLTHPQTPNALVAGTPEPAVALSE